MALKIATLNIYGLRDVNKSMSFIQWLHFVDWDVLCLQESYVTSKDECKAWFSSAGYDSIVLPGSNRARGNDQACGVPGRFIGENVTLLRDLAHYCEVTNFPAAILSLDQEKACDRVDWSFLFSTLSKMSFGDSFIKWIRLLYRNPRCSVMVNGHISPFFFPSRGVSQGCLLSPFRI